MHWREAKKKQLKMNRENENNWEIITVVIINETAFVNNSLFNIDIEC